MPDHNPDPDNKAHPSISDCLAALPAEHREHYSNRLAKLRGQMGDAGYRALAKALPLVPEEWREDFTQYALAMISNELDSPNLAVTPAFIDEFNRSELLERLITECMEANHSPLRDTIWDVARAADRGSQLLAKQQEE